MKAAAYARVSTADQVDGFSLSAQLRAIHSHTEAQGWEITEDYVDEGVSAAKESATHRPAFRRLLADVDAGAIDVVVVHKLDRFSRNLTVTIQSLARINIAGATFVSLTEHIDYTTPQGRLMLSVFGAFAQFYSDNLATEVSKGRGERARQGLWNGDLPFGYLSTGDPRKAPAIVEAEAELVRQAFSMYAGANVSAHMVASWFNEQGAQPRSKRGATKFTKATVIDMLSNPFYTGKVRYHGDVLPGAHEKIVSEEAFELVERVRQGRRKLGAACRERPARAWLLRGLVRCISCGGVLWCHPTGRGDYYRDASKLKQRACSAGAVSVPAPIIDEQIGDLIRHMVLPDDWRKRALAFANPNPEGEAITLQRSRLKERLARLREVYLDGDLKRGEYETERATLMADLGGLDVLPMGLEGVDAAGELMGRLASLWGSGRPGERAELVSMIFEEVWIDLGQRRVEWIKPRPKFAVLFDILRAERLVRGDPEQIRINHAQLHVPLLALVKSGRVFDLSELVGRAS